MARRVNLSEFCYLYSGDNPATEDLVLLLGQERVRNPGRMLLFRMGSSDWFCASRSPNLVVSLPHHLSLTNFTTWHFFPEARLCASLISGRRDGEGGQLLLPGTKLLVAGVLLRARCRGHQPSRRPQALGPQQSPAPALPSAPEPHGTEPGARGGTVAAEALGLCNHSRRTSASVPTAPLPCACTEAFGLQPRG